MKNLKKIGVLLGLLFTSFFMFSCTTELTLQLNKNGSVDIRFVGGAGEAFTQMILAASDGEQAAFDVNEIAFQLGKSGFTNVKVESKTGTDLTASMRDATKSSYLFTSNIAKAKDLKLLINLDAPTLLKFYQSSDEVIQMVLDLLIAPVFNEEEMEENEYLEVISSFYGENAAKELQFSKLKLTVINADDSKVSFTIPLVELLTLTKPISIN